MKRQFVIQRHPHVVTATEIQVKGSTGIGIDVLRFGSVDELIAHFAALGVSAHALDAARESVNSTGMASLEFSEGHKAGG